MIFISYYTLGNYEKVINQYLIPSLKKWKLFYDIESVEDMGNWQKNTHYKAQFIKKMLLKHKQSVVFLDADATVEQNPILFTQLTDYDIAYHELDWYLMWRKQSGNPKREVLSGTLYLNYNEKILKFLDKWIEENNNNICWEQKNMQKILEKWNNKLKIYNLPPKYCCIILTQDRIPDYYIKDKPVILHHQVSRRYKNK